MWFAARGEGTLWEAPAEESVQGQGQGGGEWKGVGVQAGEGNGQGAGQIQQQQVGHAAEDVLKEELLAFAHQLSSLLSRAEYRHQGLPLALLPAAYASTYASQQHCSVPIPRRHGCGKKLVSLLRHPALRPVVRIETPSPTHKLLFLATENAEQDQQGQQSVSSTNQGHRNPPSYVSQARVLLVGTGPDELLAGYRRHRSAWERGGEDALRKEMALDLGRIWWRNLGRDDRCVCAHGKESRFPYLDEPLVRFIQGTSSFPLLL
jgi:hypothetical protein